MASSQCCSNPPTLNPAFGEGQVVDDLGGVKAYVAGPADAKRAVVLFADVFGFEAPKLRKIADKVATSGFFVVVPDLLFGDPFVPDNSERPFPVWLESHPPVKGYENAKPIIAALRNRGISAVGAVGFCWGAKVVVEFAKACQIEAAVLLHPSFTTLDDIKGVKCPIEILGAEFDHLSPPELIKQFEQALNSIPGAIHMVKIFPGVEHGWSVRYNDDKGRQSAEEAHQDMIKWLVQYVK